MMIELSVEDIGRKVIYRPRYSPSRIEEGVITSFNAEFVFVRYGSNIGSKATSRHDLEFLR